MIRFKDLIIKNLPVKNIFTNCIILASGFINAAKGQSIDNSSTCRKINHNSYFRIHSDNDYFTKTDEYYTMAGTMELVHPKIKKFFLSKLLLTPYDTEAQ